MSVAIESKFHAGLHRDWQLLAIPVSRKNISQDKYAIMMILVCTYKECIVNNLSLLNMLGLTF